MKKKVTILKAFIVDNWKLGIPVVAAIGILIFLLSFQLGTLTGGMATAEADNQRLVAMEQLNLSTLIREPLFLPYNLLLYLVQLSPFGGPTAIRAIGVIFGLAGVIGMFYIFSKWYTGRVALLGTILFATSSWFLHTARFGDVNASYLLLPLLIAATIALQTKVRSRAAMLAVTVFGLSALYIPGVILFLLPALIIKRQMIIAALKAQPLWYKISTAVISLVLLSPLVAMIAKPVPGMNSASQNLLGLFGLPVDGLRSISTMITTLKDRLFDIFAYNTSGPQYVAGHLPWFDVATTLLVLLGIIQFVRYWRLDRSKLIAILAGLSIVLIALNGPVSSVILMPFLFLFAVEGMKWLLNIWLQVFPKNPFARGFAIILITLMVGTIAVFHTTKYYLAWADSPETRAVFNKLP